MTVWVLCDYLGTWRICFFLLFIIRKINFKKGLTIWVCVTIRGVTIWRLYSIHNRVFIAFDQFNDQQQVKATLILEN